MGLVFFSRDLFGFEQIKREVRVKEEKKKWGREKRLERGEI
jgi:hypothetical protein